MIGLEVFTLQRVPRLASVCPSIPDENVTDSFLCSASSQIMLTKIPDRLRIRIGISRVFVYTSNRLQLNMWRSLSRRDITLELGLLRPTCAFDVHGACGGCGR